MFYREKKTHTHTEQKIALKFIFALEHNFPAPGWLVSCKAKAPWFSAERKKRSKIHTRYIHTLVQKKNAWNDLLAPKHNFFGGWFPAKQKILSSNKIKKEKTCYVQKNLLKSTPKTKKNVNSGQIKESNQSSLHREALVSTTAILVHTYIRTWYINTTVVPLRNQMEARTGGGGEGTTRVTTECCRGEQTNENKKNSCIRVEPWKVKMIIKTTTEEK